MGMKTKMKNRIKKTRSFKFYKNYKKMEKLIEKQEKINESNNKLINSLFLDYDLTPSPRLQYFQDLSTEFLKLIDNICLRHDIGWRIEGGLALGAVRHGGFIPWDDDLDIGMLRDDYDHFIEVVPEELERLNLTDNIKITYAKRNWWGNRVNGFYQLLYYDESKIGRSLTGVDVFPYDYILDYHGQNLSDEFEEAKIKFYWDLTHGVERKDAYKTLYEKLNLTHEKQEYFIHGIEGPAGKRGILDVMAFETDKILPYKRINFNGVMLPCARDVDHYIHSVYKDPMSIPPVVTFHGRMNRLRRAPNINEILHKNLEKIREINENFDDY